MSAVRLGPVMSVTYGVPGADERLDALERDVQGRHEVVRRHEEPQSLREQAPPAFLAGKCDRDRAGLRDGEQRDRTVVAGIAPDDLTGRGTIGADGDRRTDGGGLPGEMLAEVRAHAPRSNRSFASFQRNSSFASGVPFLTPRIS